MADYIVYSDGGSRGNPGPAAWGYAVLDAEGNILVEKGETMGEATNNVAEYTGVIEGLKGLKAKIGKTKAKGAEVEARMDSELVVKQMNGEYKIKNGPLQELFLKLWNLRQDFWSVTFVHVAREKNQRADRLVNEALDGEQGGLFT